MRTCYMSESVLWFLMHICICAATLRHFLAFFFKHRSVKGNVMILYVWISSVCFSLMLSCVILHCWCSQSTGEKKNLLGPCTTWTWKPTALISFLIVTISGQDTDGRDILREKSPVFTNQYQSIKVTGKSNIKEKSHLHITASKDKWQKLQVHPYINIKKWPVFQLLKAESSTQHLTVDRWGFMMLPSKRGKQILRWLLFVSFILHHRCTFKARSSVLPCGVRVFAEVGVRVCTLESPDSQWEMYITDPTHNKKWTPFAGGTRPQQNKW